MKNILKILIILLSFAVLYAAFDKRPLADEDAYGNRLEYYTWLNTADDTLYLNDFNYSDPPSNVGLTSIYLNTTDTGGGTPTISVYLQFKWTRDSYGPSHAISDDDGNTSFTSGNKFEARLDTQNWWKIHENWRLELRRSAGTAGINNLYISKAYGATL
jgi:hypothetical protein